MAISQRLALPLLAFLSLANSFNFVARSLAARAQVRVASSATAAALDVLGDGGVVKSLLRRGTGERLKDGSVAVVRYRGSTGSGGVFAAGEKSSVTVGDGTMIPGWDAALRTMAVGEAAAFTVAPQYGYGDRGVPPVVGPAARLTFEVRAADAAARCPSPALGNALPVASLRAAATASRAACTPWPPPAVFAPWKVEVLDLKGNILTDATFADAAPLTPRTPSTIKAEFERRQAAKAADKEGLEGLLEWVKGIYIFGFFDAPKGGQLPWCACDEMGARAGGVWRDGGKGGGAARALRLGVSGGELGLQRWRWDGPARPP